MFSRVSVAGALVAASVCLTTGASAADLPRRNVPPVPYLAVLPNWTGFYVGGVVGYDFWSKIDVKPNGFAIGARAGYDYQLSNNLVFGALVEGDLNFGKKDVTISAGNVARIKHKDTFSADLRLGYAIDGANLAYLVGGYTHADLKVSTVLGVVAGTGSVGANGWNIGAGFEHKFTQNVSAFAEYRYNRVHANGGRANFSEIKLGVNYRF